MKSNAIPLLSAWLLALLHLAVPCHAADKQACEVSIAAISLPDGSDGLLHWRAGNTPTAPMQLSTRYFSESLKPEGNVIQFYKDPILAVPVPEPAPKPLLTLKLPEGQKMVYVVLWTEPDGTDGVKWRSMMLNGKDWMPGSLKVVSACDEEIGIIADSKNIRLAPGKFFDFLAADWSDSFSVRMVQLKPEQKIVFSSKWRVAPGRREICFLGRINGSIQLRSLIELNKPDNS